MFTHDETGHTVAIESTSDSIKITITDPFLQLRYINYATFKFLKTTPLQHFIDTAIVEFSEYVEQYNDEGDQCLT